MRTESLFHFTKDLETLFAILGNGFWPRISFEDISWVGHDELCGSPMVCFCDIALSKLEEHTNFYGSYGIGLHRSWGIKNGLNPLLYISKESLLAEHLVTMMSNVSDEHKTNAMITLCNTKPMSGRMMVGDDLIEKKFYEECEWRYLDTSLGVVWPSEFTTPDELERKNLETKNNGLSFSQDDVRYLLVETEFDAIPLIECLDELDVSNNKIASKLLSTKIITMNSMKSDL